MTLPSVVKSKHDFTPGFKPFSYLVVKSLVMIMIIMMMVTLSMTMSIDDAKQSRSGFRLQS